MGPFVPFRAGRTAPSFAHCGRWPVSGSWPGGQLDAQSCSPLAPTSWYAALTVAVLGHRKDPLSLFTTPLTIWAWDWATVVSGRFGLSGLYPLPVRVPR